MKNYLSLRVMKPVFQKIVSPLMALLVLFSTMSFTVDMHYCGGHLVDKAIFSEVKKCGMVTERSRSMEMESKTAENNVKKSSCCEDISVTVEGQEELKISFDKHELQTLQFALLFSYSYASLFEPLSEKHIPFDQYSPPRLTLDRYILNETFLI
ncbi:HYC_CC_PP family protein [Planktosalinus lacus]|nr:hypothetical protein [Planktosalinus lacus]